MSFISPFSYFMFSTVGFVRGFSDLWFSFKEETGKLKRIIPSVSYGVVISLGYLSIPVVSHMILNSVLGTDRMIGVGGEDVGMIGMK